MRQLLRGWFMHPGWAWGRLGGGACRLLPPCLRVGQEDPPLAPELQTSPPPDSGPAPIPESAHWPAPPAPGQARPVRPLEVEKLIAVSVWGRRGAIELRKTPFPSANHSSPSPRPQVRASPPSAGGVRDACVCMWGGASCSACVQLQAPWRPWGKGRPGPGSPSPNPTLFGKLGDVEGQKSRFVDVYNDGSF